MARFITESDCLDVDFGIGESVETEGEDFVSEEGCKAFNGCAWNRLWGGIRLREAEVEKLHGYSFLEISSVRRI